jgi:CsoR family transcriptional regulator, copper-sensing transcriptional repressor
VKRPAGAAAVARRGLLLRLKRAEGQVRAVQAMIERGADCEEVAQQLSAARKALDRSFYELMACAIEHPQFSPLPGEAIGERRQRIARALARLA